MLLHTPLIHGLRAGTAGGGLDNTHMQTGLNLLSLQCMQQQPRKGWDQRGSLVAAAGAAAAQRSPGASPAAPPLAGGWLALDPPLPPPSPHLHSRADIRHCAVVARGKSSASRGKKWQQQAGAHVQLNSVCTAGSHWCGIHHTSFFLQPHPSPSPSAYLCKSRQSARFGPTPHPVLSSPGRSKSRAASCRRPRRPHFCCAARWLPLLRHCCCWQPAAAPPRPQSRP